MPQPTLTAQGWQTVLNEPKNGGLKMAKLGVTAALTNVETAKHNYDQSQTPQHHQNYRAALLALDGLCGNVYNRYHTTFTTACQYLQGVSALAKQTARTLDADWVRVQHEEEERRREHEEHARQERERARRAQKKNELRQLVEHAIAELRRVQTMDDLNHYWHQFVEQFSRSGDGVDDFDATVMHIEHFKPQADPKTGLLGCRGEYIQCVQSAANAVSQL